MLFGTSEFVMILLHIKRKLVHLTYQCTRTHSFTVFKMVMTVANIQGHSLKEQICSMEYIPKNVLEAVITTQKAQS